MLRITSIISFYINVNVSNYDWASILAYRPDIDILLPPNDEHLSVSNKIERRAFVNLRHQCHTSNIINKLSSVVVSTTSNASTSYIRAPIEICNDWPVFCKYHSYVYHVYLCLFAVGIFLNTQIKAVLMCIDKRSVLQTDVYSLFKFVKNQMYEKKVLCLFLNPDHYKI